MDIYSYIPSPDVAGHCRKIGKTWAPFEMAVIIGRSNRPLADKHAAWRELIEKHPDMPTKANMHYEGFPSLHQKLRELLDYEERLLALFMEAESGAVYNYKAWRYGEEKRPDYLFSSFDKALAGTHEDWEKDEVCEIWFNKVYVDIERRIEVIADYDGNPTDINAIGFGWDELLPDSGIQGMFGNDMFFVDIPVPFKRGDILTIPSRFDKEAPVFVLDGLIQDNKDYPRYASGEQGDGTDMIGRGLFATDEGLLCHDHAHCQDHFEYYRGKLEGAQRILHYANLFLKGEKGFGAVELLTVQGRIMAERQLEEVFDIKTHNCHILDELLAENRVVGEDEGEAKD